MGNFKADPTIKGLKTLTESCFWKGKTYTSPVPKSAKRNLVQLLDSDDDDNENPAGEFANVQAQTSATRQEETTTTQKRRNKSKNKHCTMHEK